jgi:hypothetical protein
MRRRLPLLFVCLLASPAFAQALRFGQDVPIAAVEYDDPGFGRDAAAIATNGDGYLAVWSDSRRGQTVSWLGIGEAHIYAARLASDGTLLDPAGISIGDGGSPEVVWTGRSYVVAWTSREALHVATVAPDGSISGRRTLPTTATHFVPEMASNGTTVAVITSGGELFILDLTLAVVAQRDARPVTGFFNRLSIAAADRQYLIATTNALGVSTRTVSDDGTLSPHRQLTSSIGATDVDVASDGQSYMVLWRTSLNALLAQPVTMTNVESGDAVTLVRGRPTSNVPKQLQAPGITWRNGEYFATYHFVSGGSGAEHDVSSMRLSRTGTTIGSPVLVARTRSTERPHFATTGSGSGAMVWVDRQRRVRAGLFDGVSLAAGVPFFREVSVASAARTQTRAAMTAVDETPVVLWHEASANLQQLRIARENGSPVVVANSITPRWHDVLFDGTAVWVLWMTNETDLWLRRFTPDLEPIDANPRSMHLGRSEVERAAAGNGAVAFVWQRHDGVALQLSTLRSSGDGVVMSSVTLDPDGVGLTGNAALVWDGTTFTVIWHRISATYPPSGPVQQDTLNVARVPSGSGRPASWTIHDAHQSPISKVHAAAAHGQVTIAWQQSHKSGGRNSYVATLGSSLTNVTPVVLDDNPLRYHSIVGLLAHEDDGAIDVLTRTWDEYAAPYEATIAVRRLPASLAGVQREFTATFPITRHAGNDDASAFGTTTYLDAIVIGGMTVIAYERAAGETAGDVSRIFLRHERGTNRRRSVR